jgi:hypothetical protein
MLLCTSVLRDNVVTERHRLYLVLLRILYRTLELIIFNDENLRFSGPYDILDVDSSQKYFNLFQFSTIRKPCICRNSVVSRCFCMLHRLSH